MHQAIYLIAVLALVHYFQQTKADVSVPTFVAGVFTWLMGYRVLAWWQDNSELSTLSLLALSVTVALLTFAGEAIGIGIGLTNHCPSAKDASMLFNATYTLH